MQSEVSSGFYGFSCAGITVEKKNIHRSTSCVYVGKKPTNTIKKQWLKKRNRIAFTNSTS